MVIIELNLSLWNSDVFKELQLLHSAIEECSLPGSLQQEGTSKEKLSSLAFSSANVLSFTAKIKTLETILLSSVPLQEQFVQLKEVESRKL